MANSNLVPVVLLKRFQVWNVGETAGFSPDMAKRLIGKGIAKALEVDPAPVEDSQPKQLPKNLVIKKRRGRPPKKKES